MAVSVAKVQQVFDVEGNCLAPETEKLIRRSASNLIDYIKDTVCPKLSLEEILRERSESL